MQGDEDSPFDQEWEGLVRYWTVDATPEQKHGYELSVGALLSVAQDTPLRRFFPFTSVNRLCFATSSVWPFENIQEAFVEYSDDAAYRVCEGSPYPGDGRVVLETRDPHAAVAEVVKMLTA